MEEAVQLISSTYGGNGVLVALDFDDTLFSRETELANGQTIRYLEKSSLSDLALNGGKVHPVFEAVNHQLGLNLLDTDQSFRSIRRHFMATSPQCLLNVEDRYYSVEEDKGVEQLKQSIEALRSQGAFICIVSAACGAGHPLKISLGEELGIPKDCFLRGARKFEQVITFLAQQQDKNGLKQDHPVVNLDSPIHTFILLDDTLSYLDAWENHAKAILSQKAPLIQPDEAGKVTIVGIHYDFLGQHPEFLKGKMMEEFIALYGKDYRTHPLMQPFLEVQDISPPEKGRSFFHCFGK
jgi:hypothetical protein